MPHKELNIKQNQQHDYGLKVMRIINDNLSKGENISRGINEMPSPPLYRKLVSDLIESGFIINEYIEESAIIAVKLYEKLIASDSCSYIEGYSDYVSITIGGTNAIYNVISYIHHKYEYETILFLGFNYYSFYTSAEKYRLTFHELVSNEKNRVYPTICEIEEAVKQVNPKCIFFSQPFNPSGECYNSEELRDIIKLARNNSIILCIDKCQVDEFNKRELYVNIGKILIEEEYYENTLIINSQSKIRGIPGLRFGYIISNADFEKYISKIKKVEYHLTSNCCSTANLIDFLFRIKQYYDLYGEKTYDINFIKKYFKRVIRFSNDYTTTKNYLIKILDNELVMDKFDEYKEYLYNQYNIIHNNYVNTLQILEQHIEEHTSLDGGYNFYLKFKKTRQLSQDEFLISLYDKTGIRATVENLFSVSSEQKTKNFGVRFTLATDEDTYLNRLQKIKNYLESI